MSYLRAQMLLEQQRADLALEQIRLHLASEPQDGEGHSLHALCLIHLERLPEAIEAAREAVSLSPDQGYTLYVLGVCLHQSGDHRQAEQAVEQAIGLDPEDADYYTLRASIAFSRSQWSAALAAAEEAMAVDPEHVSASNLRARALVQLGRQDEASQTIEAALAREPENPFSHANQGWTLLHQGEHEKAMEHFREALRLDPENEFARQGIIQALQAHHVLYRWMLKYFLWMSRFSEKGQFFIIIGFLVGYRVLVNLSETIPVLGALTLPIIILYLSFAYMTWTANSLFNIVLRLHPFGRHVLSPPERIASTLNALALLIALGLVGVGLAGGETLFWLKAALGAAVLVLPITAAFRCTLRSRQLIMGAVVVGFVLVGGGAVLSHLAASPLSAGLGSIFFLGIVAFTWVGNFLVK